MDEDAFLTVVQQEAGGDREHAVQAARATLQTLGERIAGGEARDIAAQLPPELAPWVAHVGNAEPFDVEEFVRRVADREGVDAETAERDARAVFDALARALTPRELADMAAELPKQFAPLLPRGPYVRTVASKTFLRHVADLAATDEEGAARATDAVLETLAERIAGGEVEDLLVRLPLRFHPPLKRGMEQTGGKATRMSLEEFVRRVAEREGVDPEAARDHARAVFLTLRETVGEREFLDVTAELPDEYLTALAR